jgi:hypothetical protein
MSETIAERIARGLAALGQVPPLPRRGVGPLLADALEVAGYVATYAAPVLEGPERRPGLSQRGISADVADELRSLAEAIGRLVPTTNKAPPRFPTARVRALYREIRTCVRWIARGDPGVARLLADHEKHHKAARSADARVMALNALCAIAEKHADALREGA